MASQVSEFIIVETAAGIAETVAAICAFACGRPVNYPPVGFSLKDAEKISLGPAPTTGLNDLRQRASARCAACRRTPEMPFSSTGPISVKVTLNPRGGIDDLLGDEDLTGPGVLGDPRGEVHRLSVVVALLEEDRSGVQANVSGWQAD